MEEEEEDYYYYYFNVGIEIIYGLYGPVIESLWG
jgi:hypothetical protein